MKWFRQKEEQIDEHNLPTEPLPEAEAAAYVSTVAVGNTSADDPTLPLPPPYEPSVPQYSMPYQPQPAYAPPVNVYPVLPARPGTQQGWNGFRPAGGMAPQATYPSRRKMNTLPTFVGLFFVVVQLLLIARFIVSALHLVSNEWAGLILGLSELFVYPFQSFWQQNSLPIPSNIEVYTLIAVLAYGIVSRLLVRFLKILLSDR